MSEKLCECQQAYNLRVTEPQRGVLVAVVAGNDALVARLEVREEVGRPAYFAVRLLHDGKEVRKTHVNYAWKALPSVCQLVDEYCESQRGGIPTVADLRERLHECYDRLQNVPS